MPTSVIAVILALLILLGGFIFFGKPATAPSTHVMPDGTSMSNTDPVMNTNTEATVPSGAHVMPDGSMMENTVAPSNMHVMPDGSMMHN